MLLSKRLLSALSPKVQKLQQDLIAEAQKFSDYNFKVYFTRKINTNFEEIEKIKDETELKKKIQENSHLLEVLRRICMDVRGSLTQLLAKFDGSGEHYSHGLDEAIIDYIVESFKHLSDEDLDLTELSLMCQAYIPHFDKVPREDFHNWYMDTRSNLLANQPVVSSSVFESPTFNYEQAMRLNEPSEESEPICGSLEKGNKLRQKKGKPMSTSQSSAVPDLVPTSSLDDLEEMTEHERMSLFERYGFIRSEPKSSSVLKAQVIEEPKSKIRYLDGKVVDTKGKNYIEIKPEYPNMPQPTFLKAWRRYKFH